MSRAELAKQIGASTSGVTAASTMLCEQGILVEIGYQQSTGKGRKHVLLDVNTSYKFAFGVGIYKGVISVGLTTVKGDCLGKRSYTMSDTDTRDDLFQTVNELINQIARDCCIGPESILGVGVSIDSGSLSKIGDDFSPLSVNGLPVVYELADVYIQYSNRYTTVNPEQLYMFGCAKVIRDIFISEIE